MNFVLLLVTIVVVGLPSVAHSQAQCPLAPAKPADRRTDKTSLTIATYNVEWLFLTGNTCPGSGCPWTTSAMAIKHLETVSEEIVKINADILNLAEVQDCNVLKRLNEILTSKNMNYEAYLLTGTDTSTGQNMGLLTRIDPAVSLQRSEARVSYPIPSSKCSSPASGTSGVSKHFFTHFNIAGLPNPLSIFGLHLLAYPDLADRCVQREAQASVISQVVVQQAVSKGHSVVVLGDLNDFDPTVVDYAKSVPISSVLNILKDPVKGTTSDDLINVASYVKTQSDIYSCWYNKLDDCYATPDELSLIDHVLISKDLADLVDRGWMDHSYGVMCNSLESDHWPVVVKFNLTQSQLTGKATNNQHINPSMNAVMVKVTIGVSLLVCAAVAVVVVITSRKQAVSAKPTKVDKSAIPLLQQK